MNELEKHIKKMKGIIAVLEQHVAESKTMQAQIEGGLVKPHKTIDIELECIATLKTFVSTIQLQRDTNDAEQLKQLAAAREQLFQKASRLLDRLLEYPKQ